jgi:integrase
VSVSCVLGNSGTFETKAKAKRAREHARERLREPRSNGTCWPLSGSGGTTDPLFARPKDSTNVHNRERTRTFVERYGSRRIDLVDDDIVGEWLAGGRRNGTVPALRAMFNDAASAKAGRLVRQNPFARLGISRGPGRRHQQPPSEEHVWKLIRCAQELACPSFAAWLQVAAFTGLRPGELDALRRVNVDLGRARIVVAEQFNAKTRTFTPPKNGLTREAPLTNPAREAIVGLPVEGEFASRRSVAGTGRRALVHTTGRRSRPRRAGPGASTWPLAIPPARTWSTSSICRPRMWRSRLGTRMGESW